MNQEQFSEEGFLLGSILFLYVSLIRGLTYISVNYLTSYFDDLFVILISIIPIFILLIPSKYFQRWNFYLLLIPLFWFVSIIISNLLFKLIMLLVSISLVLLIFKLLFTSQFLSNTKINLSFILWFLILDQGIRLVNKGNDPIIFYDLLRLIINGLIAILWFLMIYYIVQKDNKNNKAKEKLTTKSIYRKSFAALSLFLFLVLYLIFFSNPGILTLNLKLKNPISYIVLSISSIIIGYLSLITFQNLKDLKLIDLIGGIFIFISILLFPDYQLMAFIWCIGLISLFWLILRDVEVINNWNSNSRMISISLGAGFVISLLFLVVILLSEDIIISLLIVFFAVLLTIISTNFLVNKEGHEK